MNEDENPVLTGYSPYETERTGYRPDRTKIEYYPNKTKTEGCSEHYGNTNTRDSQTVEENWENSEDSRDSRDR